MVKTVHYNDRHVHVRLKTSRKRGATPPNWAPVKPGPHRRALCKDCSWSARISTVLF